MDREVNNKQTRPNPGEGVGGGGASGPSVGLVETQSVEFESLPLDFGLTLAPVTIAYETYGRLNEGATTPSSYCTRSPATPTLPATWKARPSPDGGKR